MFPPPRPSRLGQREESRLRLWLQSIIGQLADAAVSPGWLDDTVRSEVAGQLRRMGLIALGIFALGAVLIAAGPFTNGDVAPPPWLRYACFAAPCVGLVLRKLAPRTGLLIGTVGFCCELAIGMSIPTVGVYTDNLYAATLHGPRTLGRKLIITSVALAMASAALSYYFAGARIALMTFTILALILLSPLVTGTMIREHRERAELERDRADKIAQLAVVDRRAALAEERTRMARELHDTIANHFSAIAMRSSAVLSRTDMSAKDMRAVIADIRSGSVAGLSEMRRTIEVLRSTEGDEEPIQHRLSGVDEMVERMRTAGLAVRTYVETRTDELSIAVEFAAYRIIQEALTNVLKHGHDAEVSLGYENDTLVITVDNRLSEAASGVPGSGNGLLGMRERATILGGQLEAGPYREGWRVKAVLPTNKEE